MIEQQLTVHAGGAAGAGVPGQPSRQASYEDASPAALSPVAQVLDKLTSCGIVPVLNVHMFIQQSLRGCPCPTAQTLNPEAWCWIDHRKLHLELSCCCMVAKCLLAHNIDSKYRVHPAGKAAAPAQQQRHGHVDVINGPQEGSPGPSDFC